MAPKALIFIMAYIASIVLLNLGFAYVPMIDTAIGLLSPMAVVAGLVFVLRDYAQREAGHYVLAAMIVGVMISFKMADPYVAIASATAFAMSELADFAVYSLTNKPFHKRILISSLIATPVDTLAFLFMIDGLTFGTYMLMFLSKMIAAGLVYYAYRQSERAAALAREDQEIYTTGY